MLTIQLLKPGRDTMDLLSDRNLQSRHQIWRQTPNLVPWEKSRYINGVEMLLTSHERRSAKRRLIILERQIIIIEVQNSNQCPSLAASACTRRSTK